MLTTRLYARGRHIAWSKAGWAAKVLADPSLVDLLVGDGRAGGPYGAASAGSSAEHAEVPREMKEETLKSNKNKSSRKWEIKPVRLLAPGRKVYKRGSLSRLWRRTATVSNLQKAKAEYEFGKLAPGSRQAQLARIAFLDAESEGTQRRTIPA